MSYQNFAQRLKGAAPVGAVITAGVSWGVIGFFIRALSDGGLSSMQIALVRMAVAAPSFLLFLLITDAKAMKIAFRDIWMFIGTGVVSVTLFNISYFYTMTHTDASVAVILLYTSPAFIMLLCALFFKEKITGQKLIALALTVGGCVLVSGVIGGSFSLRPFILLTGLSSGLFYALYTVFGRVALRKYSSGTVVAYTFLFALIGCLPTGNVPGIISAFSARPSLWLWAVGVGIICTVIPYFLYTWGLSRMESGKAAILVAVEPLVGALIGMLFFRESHGIIKVCGIVAILAAIIVMDFPAKKRVKSDSDSAHSGEKGEC